MYKEPIVWGFGLSTFFGTEWKAGGFWMLRKINYHTLLYFKDLDIFWELFIIQSGSEETIVFIIISSLLLLLCVFFFVKNDFPGNKSTWKVSYNPFIDWKVATDGVTVRSKSQNYQ